MNFCGWDSVAPMAKLQPLAASPKRLWLAFKLYNHIVHTGSYRTYATLRRTYICNNSKVNKVPKMLRENDFMLRTDNDVRLEPRPRLPSQHPFEGSADRHSRRRRRSANILVAQNANG